MDFKTSTEKLKKSLIGELIYDSSIINQQPFGDSIIQTLSNSNFEVIPINASSYEMCILSNNYIISANIGSVTMHDEYFNLIKKLEITLPVGCALNHRNELYISDYNNHCIYMLDLNFKNLKTVGTLGIGEKQFKNPLCICCKNEYLYICDNNNQRIQILDLDLEFVDFINLYSKPYSIITSETTIGIQCSNGTFFYDLKTKSLKKHYTQVYGRISYVHPNFYVASYSPSRILFCYDKDGNQTDEIKLNRISEYITEWADGCILNTDERLIISSHSRKALLNFRI